MLVIPTGLELIFSTALVFTNWGSGWHHLLLTAEGYVFFILTILDLLLHVLPAVRDHLPTFIVCDRILASASFIPILFYTVFIFLFTRKELINILPRKFQNVVQLTLLCFIPAIIVTNELGSFLGIQYRAATPVLIGFPNNTAFTPWSLFTNMTLTLLTSYQALTFSLAFYRLIRALISQRSQEESDQSPSSWSKSNEGGYGYGRQMPTNEDKIVLFKGTAWVTGGLKLGAVETIVGFVTTGGFSVLLIRRILRMLSRALIIIGLAKGLDTVEDFGDVRNEMMRNREARGRRKMRPSMLNINPRYSTFRQLSPTATSFRPLQSAVAPESLPKDAPTSAYLYKKPIPPEQSTLPTMEEFTRLRDRESSKRVTIRKDSGVPTLHMRLSGDWQLSPGSRKDDSMKAPVSVIYADSGVGLGLGDDTPRSIARGFQKDQLMSPLSYSSLPTTNLTTPYNPSSPPPLPSPSFVQNPPTSSGHASTVFSFLPPPPSRGNTLRSDPNLTPSLLLQRSLVSSAPPVVSRQPQQPLSLNDSNGEPLLSPWSQGQPHPYARVESPKIGGRGVVGLPSRPQRALAREGTYSSLGLTSHADVINTQSNVSSPLRPTNNKPVEPASSGQAQASDTGHSDSSHSAYSQMSHPESERTITLKPSNSLKRKPPPPVSPSMLTVDTNVRHADRTRVSNNGTINYHNHTPVDIPTSALRESLNSPITANPFGEDTTMGVEVILPPNDDDVERGYSAALNTGRSGDFAAWKSKKGGASLKRDDSKRSDLSKHNEGDELAAEELKERLQRDAMTIPWLRNPPSSAKEFEFQIQKANRVQLTRIKSIGQVPRRSTPTPVRVEHARESMHMSIEIMPSTATSLPIEKTLRNSRRMSFSFPPMQPQRSVAEEYRDKIVQGEYGRGVLRDDEILAFEDDSPVAGRNPFSRR